jgi:cyanophycinase-like exopeptidase
VDALLPSKGGIMLVGGGANHPQGAYSWFVSQAACGDIVVIENNQSAATASANAMEFARLGARSVDVFDFNVIGDSTLSPNAFLVACDLDGYGTEFLDKLGGAEAVYFRGGNQWPYVQLLNADVAATSIISEGNSCGGLVVGGTSAGMAILGQYVYTAEFTQGAGATDLTSQDILANFRTPKFWNYDPHIQQNRDAISTHVLDLGQLEGVLTETHLNDADKDGSQSSGHTIDRLGRFLSFLGAALLDGDAFGRGGYVNGIAADKDTALTITADGSCQVYGGTVYFAMADDYLGLGTILPNQDDPSLVHLDLSYVQLYWYDSGAQFQLADALRGWGTSPPDHRGWFAVHNASVVLMAGVWPPDFP